MSTSFQQILTKQVVKQILDLQKQEHELVVLFDNIHFFYRYQIKSYTNYCFQQTIIKGDILCD